MPPRIDTPYRRSVPPIERKRPKFDYKPMYPPNLDFSVGSELHDRMRDAILQRAHEASMALKVRHQDWRNMDRTLTAYMPWDEYERRLKEDDDRRPVSIVVPETYATMETLLTYNMLAYSQAPTFGFEGVGPEDVYGAILLEAIIDAQVRRSKAMLQVHTMLRDAYSYGFGVMHMPWAARIGKRTVVVPQGYQDPFGGGFVQTGSQKSKEEVVLFEGTQMEAIDPYRYLPDPSVPVYEPQKAEFIGWTTSTSYINKLNAEAEAGSLLFNVRELEDVVGGSCIYTSDSSGRNDATGATDVRSQPSVMTRPIEDIWMYWNLIPADWGLGDGETPEKWLFCLSGDEVITMAWPVDLDHGMYPVAVVAPDFGGHEMLPVARLALTLGLQEVINFYFNSHVLNVRKALNNQFIVDPKRINMRDVLRKGAAKVIRTRRPLWGQGIKDAIEQLQVQDVTQNHMSDLFSARDLSRNYSGAVDSLQGIQRNRGERVTAEEFSTTANAAVSRLQKTTMLISLQAMQDIATIMAYQTQQFMSADTFVKSTGLLAERMMAEYGMFQGDTRLLATPQELNIAFDVKITDGSTQQVGSASDWLQYTQMIASMPELTQTMDLTRVFLHGLRLSGEKNAQDFLRQGMPPIPPMSAQVMPDGQVEQEAQAGNVVPFGQQGGASAQ